MPPLPLSRTCWLWNQVAREGDFAGCHEVADWQQRLANVAWYRWLAETHLLTRQGGLVVNYSHAPFSAPGPEAHYEFPRLTPVARNGTGLGELPAVYGLSVLDHVEAPIKFLQRAHGLLRPQGLLFLTFAFWDCEGPDTALAHQDRVRIYDSRSYGKLIREARRIGFLSFGKVDWDYHGHAVEDHTLASLVLVKKGLGEP